MQVDMAVAADIRDTLMERLNSHCKHHMEDLDPEVLGVNFTAMLGNMKINLFVMWKYQMPGADLPLPPLGLPPPPLPLSFG